MTMVMMNSMWFSSSVPGRLSARRDDELPRTGGGETGWGSVQLRWSRSRCRPTRCRRL
jgi:hypothetical protein